MMYLISKLKYFLKKNKSIYLTFVVSKLSILIKVNPEQPLKICPIFVTDFVVKMVDPKIGESVADFACGTGGFLIEGLKAEWGTLESQYGSEWPDTEIMAEEQKIAIKNIRGIDKDSFLGKVAKAYMALMGDGRVGIFCENSLVNTKYWETKTQASIREKSFDVVLTNPPFGKKLKIDETEILSLYDLGRKWKKNKQNVYEKSDLQIGRAHV